ncbi:hypothetical protein [Maioricimonas sp. JC845]|uniref:hypothetical protein n=1 Tax=Maioricimonas sp. JC845 TaxID=3232138 RepID=UPI00345B3DE1
MTAHAAPKPPRSWWRRLGFALVNVWLVVHLAAIVIAPASVSPSSPLIRSAWDQVHPYLQTLYLNHGYNFFAPQPGESTLVGWEVTRDDGSTESGRFPDRSMFPRLLYHRHFMLTESLGFVPPPLKLKWHESYAQHLCHTHDGQQVRLERITHLLPSMQMVRAGVPLDAPDSYVIEPMGTYQCRD